jgi:hypothetical protein
LCVRYSAHEEFSASRPDDLVSVAEAMVYDFISRIQSREYVRTLPLETVAALREKDFSKLAGLIDGAKKFDLFKADDLFYEQLNELRGSGLLLLSKAEHRLNMLTAGKNDADAAAAAFVNCDADDGYDDDSVQYCLERRIEAEGIVTNG